MLRISPRDEHGEDPLVEDTGRETDVENDQLHQSTQDVSMNSRWGGNRGIISPFTAHQGSDGCRFTPATSGKTCCKGPEHPPNFPV